MSRELERRAQNQVLLRDVNSRIRELSRLMAKVDWQELTKYLCECGAPECMVTVELTLDEREAVHSYPSVLAIADGHQWRTDEVIERNERFTLVRRSRVVVPPERPLVGPEAA